MVSAAAQASGPCWQSLGGCSRTEVGRRSVMMHIKSAGEALTGLRQDYFQNKSF
jgi:hypothetical protein